MERSGTKHGSLYLHAGEKKKSNALCSDKEDYATRKKVASNKIGRSQQRRGSVARFRGKALFLNKHSFDRGQRIRRKRSGQRLRGITRPAVCRDQQLRFLSFFSSSFFFPSFSIRRSLEISPTCRDRVTCTKEWHELRSRIKARVRESGAHTYDRRYV